MKESRTFIPEANSHWRHRETGLRAKVWFVDSAEAWPGRRSKDKDRDVHLQIYNVDGHLEVPLIGFADRWEEIAATK